MSEDNTRRTMDEQVADLLAGRDDELHPDLVDHVEDLSLGRCLRHPLVYQIPLFNNRRANEQHAYKRAALSDALMAGDWHTVVFLHERPYRTAALVEYVVGVDEAGDPLPLAGMDEDTRAVAADVWRDSENLEQHEAEWAAMLSGPGLAMNDAEAGEWEALPDPLTIYRGEVDDGGFSWSLDRAIAEWFANRWSAGLDLTVATVAKADVVGYLVGRGESEVLVADPGAVTVVEVVKNAGERGHGDDGEG